MIGERSKRSTVGLKGEKPVLHVLTGYVFISIHLPLSKCSSLHEFDSESEMSDKTVSFYHNNVMREQ